MSFLSDKLDSKKGYMEMVENFYLGIHWSAPDESLLYYSQNYSRYISWSASKKHAKEVSRSR